MKPKAIDYIIVGQGIAGSCLALQLLWLNKKFLVVDKQVTHSATRVAAGLFNPIAGREMTKTWLADTLYPYLHTFYRRAEQFTQSNFFFPMPLYRPFVSVVEQNEWMGRSDVKFSAFVDRVFTKPIQDEAVKNDLGGLMVKQCGYVNTQIFSEAIRYQLEKRNSLLTESFDEDQLIINDKFVLYKEWCAAKIIFCTGEQARLSKFFSWLPIRPLKGETLTLETEVEVPVIYNRGVYVVPGIWKVGATYNAHDQKPGVTEDGRKELKEKLEQLIKFPYTIIGQQWGLRPTTPDRKPILGTHPEFEQLLIFNGLGTKGISLAPYFSEILVRLMENGHRLNNDVAVNRYKSLYSKPA